MGINKDLLTSEWATRETAQEYLAGFEAILPDPDPVLRKLNNEAQILKDLEADNQVTTAMLSRKNRVLNKQDYKFDPGEHDGEKATALAKLTCERLCKDLENLKMINVISGIMQAPFMGYSVLEIIWRLENNWWHIDRLEVKPQRWFAFNNKNQLVFKGQNYQTARAVLEEKFILTQHHADHDNPYGLRLLSRCLWPVAFKKGGINFYTAFVEKYGNPWPIGTAPKDATKEQKQEMAAELASMVRYAVGVIPHGASLQFAESKGSQGVVHEAYLNRWNAAISKILMGQTLTAEIGTSGSYAAANTHLEISAEIALADQHMVVAALNELAWVYSKLNVGPRELAPVFKYVEAKDLAAQAELDTKLSAMGVEFTEEHYINAYGLVKGTFKVIPKTTAYQSPYNFSAPAENKAGDSFDIIEATVKKYVPQAVAANKKFINQLEKEIDAATSFEDLQRRLAGLLGQATGPDEFQDLLGDLMFNAGLMGRYDIAKQRENDGGHE